MPCLVRRDLKAIDEREPLFSTLDHKENKDILSKTVIQQLFKRLASLLNASDEQVQIEAGAA